MEQSPTSNHRWSGSRVGITGARGALGQALARRFQQAGAVVTGFTHGDPPTGTDGPVDHWASWSCGQEEALLPHLRNLDVLVLNHGINPQGDQRPGTMSKALEVNALSSWRMLQCCERLCREQSTQTFEVWVNTSEAEIQPAVSPAYELSKRLLGQLVSVRGATRSAEERSQLVLRKLVLGPFRSELNPIGVMTADFVAGQVLWQARMGGRLIIVTPNPLTYVLMPLTEIGRRLYSRALSRPDP